jgi:protein AroM
MRVGAVTIGQSPRRDVIPDMRKILGPEIEVVERGALDDLSAGEIRRLGPQPGEHLFVTRLRDGSEVRLAARRVPAMLSGCIAELEREGVDIIVVLCTGELPGLSSKRLVLFPDRILQHVVCGVLAGGKLGVMVPAAEQIPFLRRRWQKVGYDPALAAASPYVSTPEEIGEQAVRLGQEGVDLVVLDCIGFGIEAKSAVARATGRPVILPRTILARLARELLCLP